MMYVAGMVWKEFVAGEGGAEKGQIMDASLPRSCNIIKRQAHKKRINSHTKKIQCYYTKKLAVLLQN